MPQQTPESFAADQAARDAADKAARDSIHKRPIDPNTGQEMSPFDPRYAEAQRQLDKETAGHMQQGHQADGPETPPAATFGGEGTSGADAYRDEAIARSHDNDKLQAGVTGAMNYGLGQMNAQRGPQSIENGVLTGREASSRATQGDALAFARKAAMGQAPSLAEGQTTQAMGGLMGTQAGIMGSARGLSGLNGAGLGGSAMGGAAATIASQGGFGRSAEIGTAMGQYGGLAGDARQQDLGRLSQNSQNSNFNADLNDAWQVGNGQNAINAGKVGNSLALSDQAKYGASMQPAEAQFGADQESQGWKQGASTDVSKLAAGKNNDKRKADEDLYKGLGGSLVTGAGTAAGGPVGGGVTNAAWNYST